MLHPMRIGSIPIPFNMYFRGRTVRAAVRIPVLFPRASFQAAGAAHSIWIASSMAGTTLLTNQLVPVVLVGLVAVMMAAAANRSRLAIVPVAAAAVNVALWVHLEQPLVALILVVLIAASVGVAAARRRRPSFEIRVPFWFTDVVGGRHTAGDGNSAAFGLTIHVPSATFQAAAAAHSLAIVAAMAGFDLGNLQVAGALGGLALAIVCIAYKTSLLAIPAAATVVNALHWHLEGSDALALVLGVLLIGAVSIAGVRHSVIRLLAE